MKHIVQNARIRALETAVRGTTLVRTYPRSFAALAALPVLAFLAFVFVFAESETPASKAASLRLDYAQLVAVAGHDAASTTVRNTWPAEIVSSSVLHVQPQREGVITKWNVRIGDRVAAGEAIAYLSQPPATPELMAMLSERSENATRSRSLASSMSEYAQKESSRLLALESDSSAGESRTALTALREKAELKAAAARSVLEQALSSHVSMLTNFANWRYVRYGGLNPMYGSLDQNTQSAYESALVALVANMKASNDIPEDAAREYFALAVRLASATPPDEAIARFGDVASADQQAFLDALAEYREAKADIADKETEYSQMIKEKRAMIERDKSAAQSDADAAEAAYETVRREITGGRVITAPAAGVVSAIYRKAGDLVDPSNAVAVISTPGARNMILRIRIPVNARAPENGAIISVIKPGFPHDVKRARIVGVGDALDDLGSYMADAAFIDDVSWAPGTSVRVVVPDASSALSIPSKAIWWSPDGEARVWKISEADRIYEAPVHLGRVIGSRTELYDGIASGERFITDASLPMRDGMLLDEIVQKEEASAPSAGHEHHEGMQM